MGAIRSDKRLGEREFPASNRGSRWRSLETRVSLLVLALFLASAAAISFAFNHVLEKDTEGMLGEQQRAYDQSGHDRRAGGLCDHGRG